MNKKIKKILKRQCDNLNSAVCFYKKRTLTLLKKDDGLTLIELIISLVISLIVVAAAGFILLTQSGVIRLNRSVSTEQQRLNTAFNAVRYSIRMAGFDYGQGFYDTAGSVPPVQVVQASYPGNPYEVLISYTSLINQSNACTISAVTAGNGKSASSEFNLGQYCNVADFYAGEIISITNPVQINNSTPLPPPPIIYCITGVQPNSGTYGRIQINPGKGGSTCPANPIPPDTISGGDLGAVSSLNQILFYWGNTAYNFNAPFNVPGNLYECTIKNIVTEPPMPLSTAYTAPQCSNTIILSDYINNFTVVPDGYNFTTPSSYYITSSSPAGQIQVNYGNGTNQLESPYLNLSIIGESNVALSDSPAYSVDVPYNPNAGGIGANGNASQTVGNNVLKTLNSSIFLRNIYYGS